MSASKALVLDERRPIHFSVKQALALCIVELVEDERGVVGLWQAHPQSDWATTKNIRLMGFLRRRDGRPTSIDCVIPGDVSLRASAQALVDEAMSATGRLGPQEKEIGLILRLSCLGIVDSYGQPGRPGDCEISMVNFVAKHTGLQREDAEKRVRDHIGNRIERMAISLDPGAITFANANPHATWIDEGEWEGLDDTFVSGAPLRRAITILPGFAALFDALWQRDRSAFNAAPDAVLHAAISSACATSKSASKWEVSGKLIRSVSSFAAEITEAGRKAALNDTLRYLEMFGFKRQAPISLEMRAVLLLARFPRDWVPQSDDEWRALIELGRPMGAALNFGDSTLSAVQLFPSKGRWEAYRSRLLRAASVNDIAALNRAIDDVRDYIKAFERQILKPACALAKFGEAPEDVCSRDLYPLETKSAAERVLLKGRSMARILEESRAWHARQHEVANTLSDISPGFLGSDAWEAGLPDWSIDDFQIKVLSSTADLKAEGLRGKDADGMNGLAHCVGDYSPQCKRGRSRILSLRRVNQNGRVERVSTAELSIDISKISGAGIPLLKIAQHRAYNNQAPAAEAEEALSSYLSALSAGELACDVEAFASSRSVTTIAQEAGYEFWKPGAFSAALECWASLIPKALRKWDVEAFSAATEAS